MVRKLLSVRDELIVTSYVGPPPGTSSGEALMLGVFCQFAAVSQFWSPPWGLHTEATSAAPAPLAHAHTAAMPHAMRGPRRRAGVRARRPPPPCDRLRR